MDKILGARNLRSKGYKAIAEYISVDRSNLMRELKKMEQENIIKKEGKYITFID